MELYDLKTRHLTTPIGIDRTPYFSWKLRSKKENVLQKAYKIEVHTADEIVWDSGKVENRQQTFVEYQGLPLKSATIYRWRLSVWDNQGESSEIDSHFETALMEKSDWRALWIESTIPRETVSEYKYGNTAPPIFFKRSFYLQPEIKKARLYATAIGVYRIRVNETRPDDREFAPEFTSYNNILYYQTYNVTNLLCPGDNTLDMYVGDGWFFSEQTSQIMDTPQIKPAILYQLEVEYQNGRKETIYSNGSETCCLGMIEYSDIFQGEKQDLRKIYGKEHSVTLKGYGYDKLKSQPLPPVRAVKLIPATGIFVSPKGETIVDFGQVLAGRARIRLDLPKNAETTFEYFEILDKDGNYINTMFAPQKDIVITNGEAVEHEAFFTFHGFRYIRVTGIENPRKEDFTAVLLTTEKENAGTFVCSDKRLNRLYENIRWSQWNNMMSIPTDCPTREKAGWTGDILVYARTALLNENVTPFLTSWLDNVEADQAEDGTVMIITPYTKLYDKMLNEVVADFGDTKATGVAGWSDAIVWVPYRMYQVTGNTLILREKYEAMKKWCDYIIRTAEKKQGDLSLPVEIDRYLWNTGFHFGEWLIPSRADHEGGAFEICKESSYYIAPFWGYETIRMMGEIAGILEYEDRTYYENIASKMKKAIQEGILYRDRLPDNLMGSYVIAFAFNLVPEDLKVEYESRLLNLLEKNNNCLDTGFLSTPFILDVLNNLGRKDLSFNLLWQDKMPSWLYQVDSGATAIWEAWDADRAQQSGKIVSFDHYALGCVDDWICRNVAGIDSHTPGFSHLIIQPDENCRLNYCKRTFESEAGEISVSWTKKQLDISIPPNTTATIRWKEIDREIGSGTYTFLE